MSEIQFTPAKLKALKTAYNTAIRDSKDLFIFENNEYLTTYAKYLIEYLTTKFKTQ